MANNLIVRSAGSIDLEQLNLVSQLGVDAVGGTAFRNNGALSLGGIAGASDISVSAPSAITDTLNTVTAGGDIGIEAVSGGITLLNDVTAPNIRLAAVDTTGLTTGAVTQVAGSIVANGGAGGLIVVAEGDSVLNDATNDVGSLAASVASGGFTYHDANGFSVGTVTVTPPSLGGTLSSVTTTGATAHDIALIAENGGATAAANTIALTAGNDVNANAANVLLKTVAGANPGGNIVEPEPAGTFTGRPRPGEQPDRPFGRVDRSRTAEPGFATRRQCRRRDGVPQQWRAEPRRNRRRLRHLGLGPLGHYRHAEHGDRGRRYRHRGRLRRHHAPEQYRGFEYPPCRGRYDRRHHRCDHSDRGFGHSQQRYGRADNCRRGRRRAE